jgi:hypothetical protein
MILKDKQELVRLLGLYCNELCEKNKKNTAGGGDYYKGMTYIGVKAQYNHARIIMTKISREIENELKAY